MVVAQCLASAWDSVACRTYEPGQGPLPDGLYEIDADSQLSTLVTIRGMWLFQYPGHEGKGFQKPRVEPVAPQVPPIEAKADKRKQPMTDEHKAKMLAARKAKKAEKLARLTAA
jgi:hypothetical protein